MLYAGTEYIGKDGETYILKSPQPADAESMIRYLKTTAMETEYGLSYPEEMNFTVEDEEKFLTGYAEDPRSIMIAAFDGDTLVGYSYLSSVLDQKKVAHRASFGVAVLKRAWGQGLGSALTSALIDFAKGAGYEQIELEVASTNVRAVKLYQKLGFVTYGRRPHSLKLKDGTYFDELLMVLELT